MTDGARQAVIIGGNSQLGVAAKQELIHSAWHVDALTRSNLDVRDPESVKLVRSMRRIDLLICAVGCVEDASILKMSEGAWNDVWGVNYAGVRNCAVAAIPSMQQHGGGHIVFISSQSAFHPPAGQANYATSKAALIGLAQDMAREQGRWNIRVNVILPGWIESPMTAQLSPKHRALAQASHALGRFNTWSAVARFIIHLHNELPHTSGQVFQLDSRPAAGHADLRFPLIDSDGSPL
jgi:3-oxoacyl-[acyl-carrier protein] reductase